MFFEKIINQWKYFYHTVEISQFFFPHTLIQYYFHIVIFLAEYVILNLFVLTLQWNKLCIGRIKANNTKFEDFAYMF